MRLGIAQPIAPAPSFALTLTSPAVLRLAAEAQCDPRTARRWLLGGVVKGGALTARLTDATDALGLKRAA